MKLQTQKFALAAMITMGLVYITCTIFVALFPEISTKFLGWLLHLTNTDELARGQNVTFPGALAALIQVMFYAYLTAWIFSVLHNKFTEKK